MKYSPWIIAIAFLIIGIMLGLLKQPVSKAQDTPIYDKDYTIDVTVTGAVTFPKTYQLDGRLTVNDAIKRAGGTLKTADLSTINLNALLSTSRIIVIPFNQDNGDDLPVVTKMNINTATVEALQTLPGIGPSLANAIVDYRVKRGVFLRIEDIMNVTGIAGAKYEGIKDLISVG